jgi:hypothetical protein
MIGDMIHHVDKRIKKEVIVFVDQEKADDRE